MTSNHPVDTEQSYVSREESWTDLRSYDVADWQRGKPKWYVMLWWLVQAIAFPLSWHNFNSFRCCLLRLFGAEIGMGVVIRPSARFTFPWKVQIGDYSWIGDNVVLYSLNQITIGCHSVISQKSYLCTGSHNFEVPSFTLVTAPINIGNGVWIATDCFVAAGVNIGANSVIGARSSVLKSIPAQQVAWGSPCRVRYPRRIKQ
ncbi:MAG: hormogonium polysaccharide biosynthesis acetyltransferase HpsU [Cyanobacteria bacterium P01_C01_bin.72]